MLFNSWTFVVFFIVVFALYYILPQRFRWIMLLMASYYFYASWNLDLLALIVGTTLVTYACGRWVAAAKTPNAKKAALAVGVGVPLLALFFFKYFNFLTQSLNVLTALLPLKLHIPTYNIVLPVGISFYTFQTLSYVIDVYRGDMRAEKHVGIYALYVSFFPQLVAGPIERSSNLLPQFYEKHTFDYGQVTYGLKTMMWGFFKKIIIADAVAGYVNTVYSSVTAYRGLTLILATVLFGIQIYCDFSGYSDIAIGAAQMLGFRLMKNFKSPYYARSVREFWRRWHISLSTWFSDYIYIPLGGNRVSVPRYYLNLFVTFLLSGLWHGASWTFVLWGALHGVYMVAGRITQPLRMRVYRALHIRQDGRLAGVWQTVCTLALVSFSWILFRANTLSDAWYVMTHLHNAILAPVYNVQRAGWDLLGAGGLSRLWLMLPIALMAVFDRFNMNSDVISRIGGVRPVFRWAIYTAFLLLFVFFAPETTTVSQFIYFQF